jgi:hypothetical protein
MSLPHDPAGRAPGEEDDARTRIEQLLARYPAISERELAALLRWFEREASALDVAVVASNERISSGYGRFKAEHIDRFDIWDMARAVLFLAIFGTVLLGVIWLAQ